MKSPIRLLLVQWLCALLLTPLVALAETPPKSLTSCERTTLKIAEGIVQLFKQSADQIWPGYDLTKMPFILYLPDKWALLFNYSKPVDEFQPYPLDWPSLGCAVQFHPGQYQDLAGQLAFDLPIDTIQTVAIGFPVVYCDSAALQTAALFGGYVHEAFHQYQSTAFGEIPWEREELYPILDRDNTALAYLEMRLLGDALSAMKAGDRTECTEDVQQFIAVRDERWKHAHPFVARYEQGQEIHEGTARYVEMKSLQLMRDLKYASALKDLTTPLFQDLDSFSIPEAILQDLRERTTGNTVSPENMLRNRIYPVGSAQGFLLDYFGIEWKGLAQQAGPDFTMARLMKDKLGLTEIHFDKLLAEAKSHYGFTAILDSTDMVIRRYLAGYSQDLVDFEAQRGYRIEVKFTPHGLARSRSSLGKTWIIEDGKVSLCRDYKIFTMKNSDLVLQISDAGVFERTDWETNKRHVVFFSPDIGAITLNGEPLAVAETGDHSFDKIEISGNNFMFSCTKAGTITLTKHGASLNLEP